MGFKNKAKFFKGLIEAVESLHTKQMKRFRILVTKRAKLVHKYKNRSGDLTNTLKSRYYKKSQSIKFYGMYYRKWVASRTKNDWVKNSYNYYMRNKSQWI